MSKTETRRPLTAAAPAERIAGITRQSETGR